MIAIYAIVVFLFFTANTIVSYVTPVLMESSFNSAFTMGLVLSFSSFVAIFFDYWAGYRFKNRTYRFFLNLAILFGVMTTLSLILLPPTPLFYLIPMAFWGLYYELISFSDFGFVKKVMHRDEYTKGWGIIDTVYGGALLVGPWIAISMSKYEYKITLGVGLFIFLLTLLVAILFLHTKTTPPAAGTEIRQKSAHLFEELKIWRILFKSIWPLWLFSFTLNLIDSFFWTAGVLLTDELVRKNPIGGLFMTAYSLPALFISLTTAWFAARLGKKRVAIGAGLFSGIFLILLGVEENIYMILFYTLIASSFSALSFPAIASVYEDYVNRLRGSGNSMIGLTRTAANFAYVIGPITAGFLTETLGSRQTFGVCGVLMASVSLAVLLTIPKRIVMPQTAIRLVEEMELGQTGDHPVK